MRIKFDATNILRPPQLEIFKDTSRFKVASCGRRFGKSILSSYIILTEALKNKGVYLFAAPTTMQARQIIWEVLKDKVRDKLAVKINESRLEVTLINGSLIMLRGMDRPDTARGISLSGCILDEFATMRDNKQVWQEVLRPALSDRQGWAVFISSPKGRDFFYDMYNEAKSLKNWNSWQFTTLQGGNVPPEEVEIAKNEMDERSFNQEYLASFESYQGLVVPNFDRELNKSNEIIQDDDTLIFSIDFNILKMSTAVSVLRGKELHTLDEFYGAFNTEELMESIELRYPKHRKIFHTDASGIANKSSAGGQTDISIIKRYGYQVHNLRKNPNILDRCNASSSIVCSVDGTRRWFVSPKCKRIIEAFEKHTFDENTGLPNKKHEWYDDMFDAVSYGQWHYSDYGTQVVTSSDFLI